MQGESLSSRSSLTASQKGVNKRLPSNGTKCTGGGGTVSHASRLVLRPFQRVPSNTPLLPFFSMRAGRSHRADAITNSPFVRALIRPVQSIVPAQQALPAPKPQHLIPTQPAPVPSPPVASVATLEVEGKKRKREQLEDEGEELAPIVNYTEDNLPPELNKCELCSSLQLSALLLNLRADWAQRYRLFSLFDEGCQMDLEGWYSVTPEFVAAQIAERCACPLMHLCLAREKLAHPLRRTSNRSE